eukprot:Pgem_evm1s11517
MVISVHKCLLQHGKETKYDVAPLLLDRVRDLPKKSFWTVILCTAGDFAAAVFDEEKAITHKAFC